MNTTAKQTATSARDLAQKIAKQLAQEPLEVLKTAADQVVSPETIPQTFPEGQNNENQQKAMESQKKLQDNMKSGRRMGALEAELKDIHKQDLFKDLQNKIAGGAEIPVADYPELSMEQKQVLNAQMEAVKYQKQQATYNESQSKTLFGTAKPSRRFGSNQRSQKAEAERQQTHVEKPIPPSG